MGPEFAQMGTNMVTSYIMKTYSNSQLNQTITQVYIIKFFYLYIDIFLGSSFLEYCY